MGVPAQLVSEAVEPIYVVPVHVYDRYGEFRRGNFHTPSPRHGHSFPAIERGNDVRACIMGHFQLNVATFWHDEGPKGQRVCSQRGEQCTRHAGSHHGPSRSHVIGRRSGGRGDQQAIGMNGGDIVSVDVAV
eukprot:scaffold684_cov345-Pavlova_lutheri.AAC.70